MLAALSTVAWVCEFDEDTPLELIRAIAPDLIVKGAYTQSRLRQMIFGGMTRHLILHSPLPVLFSY